MDDQTQQDSVFVYPEHQAKAQAEELRNRRIAAQQWITKAVAANPDYAGLIESRYGAMFKELIPDVKSFDDSIAAKQIMAEQPAMVRNDRMINNIYREINAASKIEDITKKTQRLQTILPKLIQSAASGGSDAMQMGEFLIGAPELNNFTRWAAANHKDIGPSSLISYLSDPATTKNIIGTDPDAYIDKVKGNYDTIADSRNYQMDRWEKASSPEWLAKNTGLERLPLFKETQQKQQYTPQQSQAPAAPDIQSLLNKYR